MYTFKLLKRTQNRSEVGPSESLEFQVFDGSTMLDGTVFAHMESDDLSAVTEWPNFQDFLDDNYDLLHYYMD
jgi:hypothetical protein